jgi:hypothetical protein
MKNSLFAKLAHRVKRMDGFENARQNNAIPQNGFPEKVERLRHQGKSWAVLVFIAASVAFGAKSSNLSLIRHFQIRNGVFPFYTITTTGGHKCSAIARVDLAHADFETKGFFKIGVLPVMALDGFHFEVIAPNAAINCFDQIQSWFGSLSRGETRLELRQAELAIAGPTEITLKAGFVRVKPDGEWDLSDDVVLTAGTNQMRTDRAVLQVTGSKAGQLIMHSDSLKATVLFSSNPINHNPLHEN